MSVEAARRLIEHLDSRIREEELGNPFFKDPRARTYPLTESGFHPIKITDLPCKVAFVDGARAKSQETLTNELGELKKEQRELVGKKSTIESKIQEYQEVEQKGICPTCDREATPGDFKHKIEQKRNQLAQVDAKLEECDNAIGQTEQRTKELEGYEEAQKKIKDYEEQLKEQELVVEENDQKAKTCKENVETLTKRLQEASQELAKFKEVSEQLRRLDVDLEKANKAFKAAGVQVSSMKTKIEESKKRAAELEAEVRSKEENVKKADFLSEFTIWLHDYFIPTVENIEKHVLITIHQEFNQLFQHWFSLLVEDPTKDALVDEDFTPIVEQDGYEQDIHYLSGGERTSIALAYRLALNMLVRKVSTSMKSGLLILDEPTDGFSKEQLFKIRDILKELQCPQIVIVSHEKELENFADQVFKVTKVNGVSSVGG